jgi:WXG100 family type VII secretion target
MGRPDVRMNYDTMEKMAKAFSTAQNQIKTTADAMKKIAQMMDGGALQGEGGNAFRGAIEGKLLPRMKKLEAKMTELSRDINGAVRATRDGVKTAKSRFK